MRKIWVLALGMFALGMDTYIVAGILPEMSRDFNKTNAEIGQGVTVFTLCFALSAPIFSAILAKYSVKNILLIALFIFGLANIMTIVAPNYSIYIISRCIAGLGAGIFSPMAVSAGSYLADTKNKGKALALVVGGMSIGTVIGVPVGLQLASIMGWRFSIGIIVVLSICAIICIFILLPNFKIPAPPSMVTRFALFLDIQVLKVIAVTVCAAIASLGLYTYLAEIISKSILADNIALFLTTWGIGGVLGSLMVSMVIDKFKNTQILMLLILICLGFSILLIPVLIEVPFWGLLPFLFWGAMGWATQAPQQHILLQNHKEHGSTSVALNSSVNYLGSAMGAALGGFILIQGGTDEVLIYGALIIIVIGIIIQLFNIFSSNP
ncbi:MFS transporter [Staphylococcus caeli]|uniref:Major facilitator superfamily protein n=1 Tax=Staphylococcus caeli TaxID=2201815 RepID=A0A1D4QT73_9STAP|nr:MFS transporter [Staphylococcus caeli]SCT38088.1 major facilitator superfamily protein [Staphylococcus caeli]SCT38272.1 major facilitator superfamily protein [Staphylococcus caeli]